MIDEFAARFVYFYTGYILAPRIFQIAAAVQARPALAALRARRLGAAQRLLCVQRARRQPFVSLTLGLVGAAAVVSVSALMAKSDVFSAAALSAGENSIVVYLAFFLGMAASRSVLLKTGLIPDLGTVALLVTASRHRGRGRAVLGGARHAAAVPVRAAGLGAAAKTSRNTRSSRRSSRRSLAWISAPGGVKSPPDGLYSAAWPKPPRKPPRAAASPPRAP